MKSWVQWQWLYIKICIGIWLSRAAFTHKGILQYILEKRCSRKHLSSILVHWFSLTTDNCLLMFQAQAARWMTLLKKKRKERKKVREKEKWQIEEDRLKKHIRQISAIILLKHYIWILDKYLESTEQNLLDFITHVKRGI